MKYMKLTLVSLLLVITMLAVLVPTALAAPPAQEGQDYIVTAGDWLSKLADKYLGNPLAYPFIVEATNRKHGP
jgi:nucleoid-associated protein YgaU